MAKKETDDLMYNKILLAANLYYKNHFSQQEIAKRLNVSRPWVSKLLAKALELGIVKITIDSPLSGDSDLEETLQQKYNLQRLLSSIVMIHTKTMSLKPPPIILFLS